MENNKVKQGHNQDGHQENADKNNEAASPKTNHGQASYRTGSTTQGGSNFGQGSSALGGESYHQGDAKNNGTNYDNESGLLTSVARQEDEDGEKKDES